jgi:exopolyphosphatase / guanosine-5'-triphosphate,3'-diphosphate pyrophosphatase
MRVGIIDVGSNTVRLLVSDVRRGSVESIREEREFLGLGAEILAHDRIRLHKLRRVAEVTKEYAAIARQEDVRTLETVVTAPGRQGRSADELVSTLARATAADVRVVSAEEEGRLAFLGAVSRSGISEGVVAVCDVGGGSTEIVLGTPLLDPSWIRSVNLGSLRLTAAKLPGDPPAAADIAAARSNVRDAFAGLGIPKPDRALATGGSARAIAKITGGAYGPDQLERLSQDLAARPAAENAYRLGVEPERAQSLLAGALILREVSTLLGTILEPARGGVREGAALAAAAKAESAAT